jgi:hypothetical protein
MTWVPWYCTEERVDFAIWSRKQGFLIDNATDEKARQEAQAARDKHTRRVAAETESKEAADRLSDALDSLVIAVEGSPTSSAGHEDS